MAVEDTMNAPKLQLVRTREQTIEEALQALTNVIADTSIDAAARRACAIAHGELHACRSPETVKRLERDMGLRK